MTERELEIARLIDRHFTQEEIGRQLGVSRSTVKKSTDMMRLKLGCTRARHIPVVLKRLGVID